jgi:hypothetical protein
LLLLKVKGDTRARLYHPHFAGKLLVMSFMTLGELDRWALERSWGQKRKARMEQHVRRFGNTPGDLSRNPQKSRGYCKFAGDWRKRQKG